MATNAPDFEAEKPERTKKTKELNRRSGRFVARTLALGTSLWCAFGAAPVQASDRLATSSVVEAGIGTLPLLAAMGLGILVSVGAVIAFLQMTAKSKGIPEDHEEAEEDSAE
ncbi:hypothetical protein [Cohnella thailandensis]|uniref:Uncharacterized protein n=1 Tax=Cohnella thailandensis TaxID=557557 RepID=A0A841T2U8_9BACL|nr:hypothetical protein [Cohnella thailandensis]MBB6637339.1 hypothetical protein [Cohnella thailandensis]MBP1976667.1 hypothetical protein [Cohnella thailandensis]